MKDRRQQRRAIGDCGIDDLSFLRRSRFENRTDNAEREHEPAAAHVADERRRRPRLSAWWRAERERAGECEVVDVVARRVGERPCLAPARHAPVDELGIARETDVGTEAVALHDAWAEPLDQS